MTQAQYIVGIDEVGRGPVAGPVAVCAAVVEKGFDFSVFPFLTDSKKLSEKRREEVSTVAHSLQEKGNMRFSVRYESAETIDTIGIEKAIQNALTKALDELELSKESVHIFLDGRLKAPGHFEQETIIGGDGLVPVISLASVIAKVSRDQYMKALSSEYPLYGFSSHKGYGTAAHIKAIQENGLSDVHRKTFLSRIAPSR